MGNLIGLRKVDQMKLVKIEKAAMNNNWAVMVSTDNSYRQIFDDKDYGLCIIVAASYVGVGYKMVDPNGHLSS